MDEKTPTGREVYHRLRAAAKADFPQRGAADHHDGRQSGCFYPVADLSPACVKSPVSAAWALASAHHLLSQRARFICVRSSPVDSLTFQIDARPEARDWQRRIRDCAVLTATSAVRLTCGRKTH